MLFRLRYIAFYLLMVSFVGCQSSYQAEKLLYKNYSVNKEIPRDSALVNLVEPYADSMKSIMDRVVAKAAVTLTKEHPEGTLGNVIVDAIYYIGQETFNNKVDAAIMNYGGIRLNSLAAGDITLGKVFELAPFDNTLVLLDVPGTVLRELCDHISRMNGWPVAHITWQIKENKAINILVDGNPLQNNSTYKILTNDYVANGGDDCDMLRPLKRITNGYFLRDALLVYLKHLTAKGEKLTATIENRITNVE